VPSVTIISPTENGEFSGPASGTVSQMGGTVVVKFWRTDPTGQNPEPPPDAQANATFDKSGLVWTANLDLSAVAGTTTGYLRAVFTVDEQTVTADVSPLTWAP
jgi:hypothetical protein